MNEELRSALEENEKILYIGKAEKFKILDKTNKDSFVLSTVMTVLICTALIISYIVEAAKTNNFKILIPLIIAGIGYVVITGTIRDAKNIRKQQYVITNRRLIRTGDTLSSLPYSAVKQYLFKMDEDGHTSLLIGQDGEKLKSKKWRRYGATTFDVSEAGNCDRAVFYAISKPDEFQQIFERQMLNNK